MKKIADRIPYFLCFVIAFVLSMKQLREPDVWWQLLAGKWMLQHGAVTKSDMFSYTMAGHTWINVKWLYEIMIATLEKIFGPEGVLLLQGLVSMAIVYFLIRSSKLLDKFVNEYRPGVLTAISILLFLAIVEYRMAGRPEMISHLLCAVFLFFILKYPALEWRKIFWLIPLQCLWANMHEGYPVGLVILAALVAGNFFSWFLKKDPASSKQTIRSIVLFVAALLAILINPNGIQLWTQPFEIYRQVGLNKYTTELYSFTQSEYWTIEAIAHVTILSIAIVFWLLRIRKEWKNKNSFLFSPAIITNLLLILLFGYLSLTANRNIIFSEIVLFPSIPFILTTILKPIRISFVRKNEVLITSLIAVLFYLSIVSNKFYRFTNSPNRYGLHVNMLHNPIGAANFIKQNHITGVAFSDYFVSSYLLWSMYPNFKSYIDLRDLDVFPVSFFDEYFSMYSHPDKFYEEDRKYNFNYVVISTSQLIGLQQKLYYEKGFFLIYVDPVTAIFVKETDANKALINNNEIVKLFNWPEATEDPSWAVFLTKMFNPACYYDEEDNGHANAYAIAYYTEMKDYPTAIKIGSKFLNDPDVVKATANAYNEYAKAVPDPKLKQAFADSASKYAGLAKTLEP